MSLHDSTRCVECLNIPIGRSGRNRSHIWFSPHFLEVGHAQAPACLWEHDGRRVVQTFTAEMRAKGAPRQRIWILTDHYDARGFRLAVWPD